MLIIQNSYQTDDGHNNSKSHTPDRLADLGTIRVEVRRYTKLSERPKTAGDDYYLEGVGKVSEKLLKGSNATVSVE